MPRHHVVTGNATAGNFRSGIIGISQKKIHVFFFYYYLFFVMLSSWMSKVPLQAVLFGQSSWIYMNPDQVSTNSEAIFSINHQLILIAAHIFSRLWLRLIQLEFWSFSNGNARHVLDISRGFNLETRHSRTQFYPSSRTRVGSRLISPEFCCLVMKIRCTSLLVCCFLFLSITFAKSWVAKFCMCCSLCGVGILT